MSRIAPGLVACLLVACSHPHGASGGGLDGGGGGGPSDDASCGQTLDVQVVQPDVMIALDRSCSMTRVIDGTSETKWQAAVAAIADATATYAQPIRWGLTLFPDISGDSCAQEDVQVPIGDGHAATIQSLLEGALDPSDPLYPDDPCSTNIDTGIETAATDPGLADPDHPGDVVLVTDGKQSKCAEGGGDPGTEAAVQALAQRGVRTYVVGFGSSVDTAELDKLATLGGAPLSAGSHAYYQADSAGDLDAAIAQITSAVVSCSYHVDPAPPDLDQTYVWLDHGQLVPRDPAHAAGWDFDPATETLSLYGSYCSELETGGATKIDVVFGCPQPPIQ